MKHRTRKNPFTHTLSTQASRRSTIPDKGDDDSVAVVEIDEHHADVNKVGCVISLVALGQ